MTPERKAQLERLAAQFQEAHSPEIRQEDRPKTRRESAQTFGGLIQASEVVDVEGEETYGRLLCKVREAKEKLVNGLPAMHKVVSIQCSFSGKSFTVTVCGKAMQDPMTGVADPNWQVLTFLQPGTWVRHPELGPVKIISPYVQSRMFGDAPVVSYKAALFNPPNWDGPEGDYMQVDVWDDGHLTILQGAEADREEAKVRILAVGDTVRSLMDDTLYWVVRVPTTLFGNFTLLSPSAPSHKVYLPRRALYYVGHLE